MNLTIYPAIDLRGGKVVRLRQGEAAAETRYSDDPAATAGRWAGEGAEWLHVVNLDGAFGEAEGARGNLACLAAIVRASGLPVQFGGGLRTLPDIARALSLGARRVVLGTAAVEQPELVQQALARFGAGAIVLGLDARAGKVSTRGWREGTQTTAEELAAYMRGLGLLRAVYTDIARDGMLAGAAVDETAALARASGLRVIASGGVSTVDDVRRLAAHVDDGVEGAIIGQALYGGTLSLVDALAAAREA